jgi:hypothetical protein
VSASSKTRRWVLGGTGGQARRQREGQRQDEPPARPSQTGVQPDSNAAVHPPIARPVPVPVSRPSPSVPSHSQCPVPVPASRPSPSVPSQSQRPVPVPVSRPSPSPAGGDERCPLDQKRILTLPRAVCSFFGRARRHVDEWIGSDALGNLATRSRRAGSSAQGAPCHLRRAIDSIVHDFEIRARPSLHGRGNNLENKSTARMTP